jgi:mRNA turnover protein 4
MPKSKRNKIYNINVTRAKGLCGKKKVASSLAECVGKFSSIHIFKVENYRSSFFKRMKRIWNDSRFFMGKNKVMARALGRNIEEELEENLHKVSGSLHGEVGLLFTNRTLEEVKEFFEKNTFPDYPRHIHRNNYQIYG